MSKEDIKAVADVRRSIWTSGFQGLFFGGVGGYVLHGLARAAHARLSDASKLRISSSAAVPIRFTRNTVWLSVMAGSALGSFLLASTTGKNRVHELHGVYELGKRPSGTEYQKSLARARDREEEIRERVRRRVSRRATMRKRLEEGHGLSDSHGGHWTEAEEGGSSIELGNTEAAMMRRRTRKEMQRQIMEEGHGLSNSHGGHW
eukprot:CAMPEP_0183299716 /NCGR_PEP_ID=MMETSP0160_2-20130417/6374_1 /TAXON_ID=2839 ORGANISM="Odontella Sinensis, Strain Grunow 1884" /NCGR_SAMPLE_ID=MMETSP0160_2 /ASSEMBLY_ACC=CAM_ASM_000250 /LENGTH=203 /DNA_ID=CAMNT_0025462013 /DNA_START=150 /DNA_END=758 /DNA_ORIENTATION=-